MGLTATKHITDHRLEFFREAGIGYNINAYFAATNVTATLDVCNTPGLVHISSCERCGKDVVARSATKAFKWPHSWNIRASDGDVGVGVRGNGPESVYVGGCGLDGNVLLGLRIPRSQFLQILTSTTMTMGLSLYIVRGALLQHTTTRYTIISGIKSICNDPRVTSINMV